MATIYTATLEVRCWKEHTCSACGTVYRYLFTRTKKGQGGSQEAAGAAATRAVIHALQREVEMRPCPSCGHYQPEMIGERRAGRHWILFWPTLALLAVILLFGATALIADPITSWIAFGLAAVVVVFHLLIASRNPNKNLDVNQELARDFLDDGSVQTISKSANAPEPVADAKGGAFAGILLGMAAALLLIVAAELVRMALAWPVNWDWYPQIVGPGDEPYTYFPERIESIGSHWKGVADATVVEPKVADPRWLTSTRTVDWGNSISVKSSEKHSRPALWVRVHIPPREELAGKEVRLNLVLHAAFPVLMGNAFDNTQRTLTHSAALHLAAPHAGRTYTTLWWAGGLGGSVLLLILSWAFVARANALVRRGVPTRTYPVEQPPSEQPPPAEPPLEAETV